VKENGTQFIRHYLIDFGASLGSASYGPNSPRSGNDYLFDWGLASRQFVSFGLWVPKWAKAKYPDIPAVGAFESAMFDPERWVPEYPNAAFINMDSNDAFWAAKQVMSFGDEEIRAIVATGEFSSAKAEEWVVQCLKERRNKVGRTFFSRVAALDRFDVNNGRLAFVDLEASHFGTARPLKVQWHTLDNRTGTLRRLDGAMSFDVPGANDGYLVAEIRDEARGNGVLVYIRDAREVIGVERTTSEALLLTRR
jgi:hypothetical protein